MGRRDGADAVHAIELLAHAQDYDGDGRRDIWTLPTVCLRRRRSLIAYGWKSNSTARAARSVLISGA